MAKNQTSFAPGCKPGPGRPKGKTAREAVRAALAKPSSTPGLSRVEEWAEQFTTEADPKARLEILKWLEGANPKDAGSHEDEEESTAVDEHGNEIDP